MPPAARPGARGGDLGEGTGGGSTRSPRERRRLAPRHAAVLCLRSPVYGRWPGHGGHGAVGPWVGVRRARTQPPHLAHSSSRSPTHTHTHSLAADTQHWPADAETQGGRLHTMAHTLLETQGHTHAGTHTDIHCHTLITDNDTPSHTHWYTLVNTFLLTVMLSYTGHTPTHISSTIPSGWHTHVGLH